MIAGGGTGGHVVPSLEIARALVRRGHEPQSIELYGSRRGHEATTWPTLEFPFTLLPGRGIRRSLAPRAILANIGAVAGLLWACLRAFASFAHRRPRVVVIVGGYASFPAGLAALLTRVPLVSMTTDAVPGAVNGFLGRFAAANAVAFPETALPRTHVTGTPVLERADFARPHARRPGLGAGRAGLTVGPADRGRLRRLARGSAHQSRRGRGGLLVAGPVGGIPFALPRDRAKGLRGIRDRCRRPERPADSTTDISATGSCPSRTTWPSSTPRRTSASPGPGP